MIKVAFAINIRGFPDVDVKSADKEDVKIILFFSQLPSSVDRSDIVTVGPNRIRVVDLCMHFISLNVFLFWLVTILSSYPVTTDKIQETGKWEFQRCVVN